MNNTIRKLMTPILMSMVIVFILPINALKVQAESNPIAIDGYYDDWSNLPYSWEMNYDNPYIIENFWDGTSNITKKYLDANGNPYNIEIRHKMSMYCDGTNVYLHITCCTQYPDAFQGADYQFFVDGQMAAYCMTFPGGGAISTYSVSAPGVYSMEIRNRATSISNTVVPSATGMYTVNPGNVNNEFEMKIPLAELKKQNPNINIDHFNMFKFTTLDHRIIQQNSLNHRKF